MNQLSILDLIFSNDVAEERENTEKNGYEKDVDYLNREEVIKSLVRKKTPNTRMYSNIFDYPLKKSSVGRPLVEKIIDKIAKGVIEPILSTINDDNFEEVKSKLMKMIDKHYDISLRKNTEESAVDILNCYSTKEYQLELEISTGLTRFKCYGFSSEVIRKSHEFTVRYLKKNPRNKHYIVNVCKVFAFLYYLTEIGKEIVKIGKDQEKKGDNSSYVFFENRVKDLSIKYLDAQSPTLLMAKDIEGYEILIKIFERYKIKYKLVENWKKLLREVQRKDNNCVLVSNRGVLFLYYVEMGYIPLNFVCRSFYYRNDLFDFEENAEGCLFYISGSANGVSYEFRRMIEKLLENIYEDISIEKQNKRESERMSKDYASSFMTKKNIPDRVLKEMKDSLFNKYFGYVEIDESCDIEKIREIALEFDTINKTFFNELITQDNVIRFRRLGKHKAGGLYWYTINNLCVDVDSPSSLIHEYGHLIDYKYGILSSRYQFVKIKELYVPLVYEKVKNNSELMKMWNGNSRYNKAYYTNPVEIFARSFEVYMSNRINNSLKPDTSSFAYLDDENYVKEVNKYFDELMKELVVKKAS